MPDFYKRVTDAQGSLEQLVRKVPGFKGYFERQDRRVADRLLRERLVLVLGEQLREFGRLQKRLVEGGGVRYMDRLRGVDAMLRTFVDKVESAPSGYAGLLDAVKVDEAALARVYAFDYALFAYQDQLAVGLQRLEETIGSDAFDGVVEELEALVGELINTFGHRDEAMRGLQESV